MSFWEPVLHRYELDSLCVPFDCQFYDFGEHGWLAEPVLLMDQAVIVRMYSVKIYDRPA